MKILKRDGRIKEFDIERIKTAIQKCYIEVLGESDGLSCFKSNEIFIIPSIEVEIERLNKEQVSIEEIQDIIVGVLNKLCIKAIPLAYQRYRDEREEERVKNSKREQFYNEVLECSNIDNDNANVDQYSFSGKKYRIADYEQKSYALRNLISKEGKEAFEEGLIYYHDLSSYAIGEHNCSFTNLDQALNNGFVTRNGDVRPANSYATACQLVAVVFQCGSQVQYGGIASNHLDFTLAPFVKKSFIKHFREGLFEKEYDVNVSNEEIYLGNAELIEGYPLAYDYAIRHLNKEGKQATEGLFHNLNTLESRAGSQLPFTSINFGRDTSKEGRLVNRWLLEASKKGIGKNHRTSIFPIGIFQYKKGINAKENDVNYDLKKLAIESLSRRIYPNIVNGDWTKNIEDENNPDTFMATMG